MRERRKLGGELEVLFQAPERKEMKEAFPLYVFLSAKYHAGCNPRSGKARK